MLSLLTRNFSCCVTLPLMKVTCTFDRMLMLFVRVETVKLCCSSFHPLTNRLETSRCGFAFHTAVKNENPNITCGMFSACD